ncbi:SGNH/GDSL hydrolase family protein [Mesorhizobium sp. M1E.F.Ca.ET.041.01.1.1]|uniref:SGNH/GDSL hydrolase family protein n=1 Tax=Mesorhizobium sp. M1E.F.Ca.ET.041.01.1.1 TaxID=2496759 RepID=UPI0016774CD8|nr:SGNH/GDSL hydrolase family protein [Mesorhizobium sp. M1E.F.Ca.ET.041.01.1.1]
MAKKQNPYKAVAVGKALALATLKRRAQAIEKRQRVLAKAKIKVEPTARNEPTKAPVTHASMGVLIAEGDSWFDYPFHDILSDLEDSYGFDVESAAHRGDTVEDMAYSDGQLDDFSRRVEKVLRTGVEPRAILLSGGGNDVAGDEFAMLLNHAMSSIAGLNQSIVTGVVDQRIRDAYVTILSAITEICKAHLGHPVPIVIHGYDYPVPDGRGFLGGWGPFPGPWLEPGFRRKGYSQMSKRRQICVELIDRFNTMLAGLAGISPFGHVRFLDLRNTLATGSTYKTWWANELHPTSKGFDAVTKKFVGVV